MFALVKFAFDGEIDIVPSSFIQDFDINFNKSQFYKIFRSSIDNDSPKSLLKNRRRSAASEREKDDISCVSPVMGYYLGKILMLAETKEEIIDICGASLEKTLKANVEFEKNIDSQTKNKRYSIKKKGKENRVRKLAEISSSDSDSEDVSGQISSLKRKLEQVTNELNERNIKYKLLKEKYGNLEQAFMSASHLNMSLQEQNIQFQKQLLSGTNSIGPNAVLHQPEVQSQTINRINQERTIKPEIDTSLNKSIKEFEFIEEKNLPLLQDSLLTEQQLEAAYSKVKVGHAGDSMFIKILSVLIFGEEVLRKSSVTGQKCNAKKDCEAKPALCPVKLNYLKDLFIQRLKRESPSISESEIVFRCRKINLSISEKIGTLNRVKHEEDK